jgi:valyl-tRNA synthetase
MTSNPAELTKFFDIQNEPQIHKKWDFLAVYKYQKSQNEFSIDTPPPTVSGYLHMGHVFSYVQCDIIARYNRIAGKSVFYPIGFDDNGLPTERLVEKQAGKKVGINCTKEEFEEECYKAVDDVEGRFEELFRSIGISYDWSLKYQTVSKKTEAIVLESFADLHAKGLIYLKNAPVYWDIEDKTALAQADLEDKDLDSTQYFIPFSCSKTGKIVKVMTTRPELLPACVAVLHHPDDIRFTGISSVKLPFFDDEVPLIADETVKIDKGTGVVMCCSYGDWADVEWIRKHKLTPKPLMLENGEIAHEFYKNPENGRFLRVANARTKIVEEMAKLGLILDSKKILHSVKCGERSGKPVEIIEQKQIYIKTLPFKNFLLRATKELEFTPSHMQVRLEKWIEGLNQDWCISRNRFFGIEIPYYTFEFHGEKSEIIFPSGIQNSPEVTNVRKVDGGYLADYKGVETKFAFQYVFDTWFTSSLTPQIAKNSLKNENLPLTLRPQAHEIIRTWTFYTLLKSVLHACEIDKSGERIAEIDGVKFSIASEILAKQQHLPWKQVALSGWCLASDKTKMSKSKGNVTDPFSLIQKHGADAVRFWCSNTPLGTDSAYSEDRLELGKKFTTKLWNCLKFAMQNEIPSQVDVLQVSNDVDFWAISEMKKAVAEYRKYMEKMDYFHARKTADDFFWNIFCDNYLEFIKIRYYGTKAFIYKEKTLSKQEIDQIEQGKHSAIATVCTILKGIITLYSPFCPFICEKVQEILFNKNASIHEQGSMQAFENTINNITQVIDGEKWLEVVELFRKSKAEGTHLTIDSASKKHLPLDIIQYIGL